jgi:hypothetical protein
LARETERPGSPELGRFWASRAKRRASPLVERIIERVDQVGDERTDSVRDRTFRRWIAGERAPSGILRVETRFLTHALRLDFIERDPGKGRHALPDRIRELAIVDQQRPASSAPQAPTSMAASARAQNCSVSKPALLAAGMPNSASAWRSPGFPLEPPADATSASSRSVTDGRLAPSDRATAPVRACRALQVRCE